MRLWLNFRTEGDEEKKIYGKNWFSSDKIKSCRIYTLLLFHDIVTQSLKWGRPVSTLSNVTTYLLCRIFVKLKLWLNQRKFGRNWITRNFDTWPMFLLHIFAIRFRLSHMAHCPVVGDALHGTDAKITNKFRSRRKWKERYYITEIFAQHQTEIVHFVFLSFGKCEQITISIVSFSR